MNRKVTINNSIQYLPVEYIHIYLWIFKDLCWTLDLYWLGVVFGVSAISFSFVLFCYAIKLRNLRKLWHSVGITVWLLANFIWMSGEFHDSKYYYEESQSKYLTPISGWVMIVAFVWILSYYVVVMPSGIPYYFAPVHPSDENIIPCRFEYIFGTWSEYEDIHILLWLGTDCAWNHMWIYAWSFFLIPTLLLALDFVFSSFAAMVILLSTALQPL